MISLISGAVAQTTTGSLVVQVGGFGINVLTTPNTAAKFRRGSDVSLSTHLVVREDALILYGFESDSERSAFETLLAVPGVGPKVALALLSVHTPESLAAAVQNGDQKTIQKVPGIGAKLAGRLVLELGGKLSAHAAEDARAHVVQALQGLGWSEAQSHQTVEGVTTGPITEDEVPTILRAALQKLGSARG